MAKNYKEKLLDVKWQKKRLEILEKDNWRCRACHTKDGTMHVHHLWYESGKDPWEVPEDCLITLCSNCHERAPHAMWQQAFLDLNCSERELMDIAITLHWVKKRQTEFYKDILEKHKARFHDLILEIDLFDSSEDLDKFYESGFRKQMRDKYYGEG